MYCILISASIGKLLRLFLPRKGSQPCHSKHALNCRFLLPVSSDTHTTGSCKARLHRLGYVTLIFFIPLSQT